MMKMRNTGWKIQLGLLGAIIRNNILEYRRYPLEITFTFLMQVVWFLPTYFLDIIRVHTLTIKPLVSYGLEVFIFFASSLLFPVGGIWLFNYIDRKCRIDGSLQVHKFPIKLLKLYWEKCSHHKPERNRTQKD